MKMLPAQLTPIYINQILWRVRFNSLDEKTARKTCLKLLSKIYLVLQYRQEQILGMLLNNSIYFYLK